jgi:hypothetical protein
MTMMKKIVSIFLIAQLLLPSAFAGGKENLKNAFDELSYALTVEWDQRDQEFSQRALLNFRDQVSLLRREGLSDADMAEAYKSMLNDRPDADVDQFVRNLRENKNAEESLKELRKLAGLSYDQGASYVPVKSILLGVAGGASLVFVAGLLMWELGDPQIFGEYGWK